jgi:hypothetical protein
MPDVTFVSDRFRQTPAPDAINEMLGRDLAAWLRAGLLDAGFEAGEVIPEDYGYGFWLVLAGSHYWITHTMYLPGESDGVEKPTWLVGIHYDPGCLYGWWLRRRPGKGDQARIARAVHVRLKADPTIVDIQWWAQGVGSGDVSPEPPIA